MVEGGPLSQADFAKWSKNYVLFCHITTKVEGEPYPNLLSRKGGTGFPHIVFLNASGDVLEKPRGRSVAVFERGGRKARKTQQELADLEKKAAADDGAARKAYFRRRLELGHPTFAEACSEIKALGLTPDEIKPWVGLVGDLGVTEVIADLSDEEKSRRHAAKAFAEMARQGWVPGTPRNLQPFWMLAVEHAEQEKDIALIELAITSVEKAFGERAQGFVDSQRAVLERLREEKGGR